MRTYCHAWSYATLALVAGALGCQEPWPSKYTTGEMGRVEFQYSSKSDLGGVPCFISCGLDWPMMEGSREWIRLNGWFRMPAVVASSSDPSVFTVQAQQGECGSDLCPDSAILQRAYSFQVQAVAAGEAELVLKASDGSVFDKVQLAVGVPDRIFVMRQIRKDPFSTYAAEVASIELELYGSSGNNGGSDRETPVWVRAQDKRGRSLMNSYGVLKRVDDDSVAGLSVLFVDQATDASQFDVVPRAIGTTVLNLSAGAVSLSVPINVR